MERDEFCFLDKYSVLVLSDQSTLLRIFDRGFYDGILLDSTDIKNTIYATLVCLLQEFSFL